MVVHLYNACACALAIVTWYPCHRFNCTSGMGNFPELMLNAQNNNTAYKLRLHLSVSPPICGLTFAAATLSFTLDVNMLPCKVRILICICPLPPTSYCAFSHVREHGTVMLLCAGGFHPTQIWLWRVHTLPSSPVRTTRFTSMHTVPHRSELSRRGQCDCQARVLERAWEQYTCVLQMLRYT